MPSKITQLHICGIYNTIKVGNASLVKSNDVGREIDMARPSLNVMRARIWGKVSRTTLLAFALRPRKRRLSTASIR